MLRAWSSTVGNMLAIFLLSVWVNDAVGASGSLRELFVVGLGNDIREVGQRYARQMRCLPGKPSPTESQAGITQSDACSIQEITTAYLNEAGIVFVAFDNLIERIDIPFIRLFPTIELTSKLMMKEWTKAITQATAVSPTTKQGAAGREVVWELSDGTITLRAFPSDGELQASLPSVNVSNFPLSITYESRRSQGLNTHDR